MWVLGKYFRSFESQPFVDLLASVCLLLRLCALFAACWQCLRIVVSACVIFVFSFVVLRQFGHGMFLLPVFYDIFWMPLGSK